MLAVMAVAMRIEVVMSAVIMPSVMLVIVCLLYTSDAADEL